MVDTNFFSLEAGLNQQIRTKEERSYFSWRLSFTLGRQADLLKTSQFASYFAEIINGIISGNLNAEFCGCQKVSPGI
jgi:hypothetical protein